MKITEVRTIPLSGGTHDTGWPGGKAAEEQMNTLVEVETDEGLTGIGSCFTSRAPIEGALELLRPMLIGETGLEAERVAEKPPVDLLAGAAAASSTRSAGSTSRCGTSRPGARPARLPPPRRQLPRPHQALRVDALRRPTRPA